MAVSDATADSWELQVLAAQKPVAVEFWAPWCPWCRKLMPEFENLSEQYEGKLVMLKLNSDDYPDIAQRYGVMGLPTIKIFCRGRPVGEVVGFMPQPRLKAELDRMLQNQKECFESSSEVRR